MSTISPEYRIVPRRTFLLWLLLVVVGAGAVGTTAVSVLRARAQHLELTAQSNALDAAYQAVYLLRIVLTPMFIFVGAMALYLTLVGGRTTISKCSPPPGSWILEGQEVKSGRPAVRIGWAMVGIGVLLLSGSLYGLYIAWV